MLIAIIVFSFVSSESFADDVIKNLIDRYCILQRVGRLSRLVIPLVPDLINSRQTVIQRGCYNAALGDNSRVYVCSVVFCVLILFTLKLRQQKLFQCVKYHICQYAVSTN